MFRFVNPEYLYFLISVPILMLFFAYGLYTRKKKLQKIGDLGLLESLMPDVSLKRQILKFVFVVLALVSLIIMMARPQMGMNVDTKERHGIEMVVALDVSNSMLATDVKPQRMDKAKMLVSNIADKMTNDKIALVVFAGQAFIQLPITSDFVSAKMFLDAISPNMVPSQGTNIGEAINLSMNSFTAQKNVQRAIVVITDGEDQAEEAENAAAEAAKKGIHIFVLGIGSPKGATIPMADGGSLRDKEGNIVISKLNEEMCNKIATAGRGAYIHVDNSNIAQERLYYELNKLEKTTLGTTVYSDYAEQFQVFVLIALLLLVLDALVLEKKKGYFKRFKFLKNYAK